MRKIFLLIIFFLITPITLGVSFFTLNQVSQVKEFDVLAYSTVKGVSTAQTPSQLFAALPEAVGGISTAIVTGDARPVIIDQYLKAHNSPMAPHADFLFEMAEKYGLDYRLMIAIAQCESNLCKKAPPESYNCWGFENGETKFLSWEQAIEQVAKTLKEEYLDKGLSTPEEIMAKYAPPSVEKGGPWAKCVNQFLEELE
jgi:hypothetical protein